MNYNSMPLDTFVNLPFSASSPETRSMFKSTEVQHPITHLAAGFQSNHPVTSLLELIEKHSRNLTPVARQRGHFNRIVRKEYSDLACDLERNIWLAHPENQSRARI